MVLENVIKEMNITSQERIQIPRIFHRLLTYADDLEITKQNDHESHYGLKSSIYQLEEGALKVGLQINENKIKYMVVGKHYSIIFSSLYQKSKFRKNKTIKIFRVYTDGEKLNLKRNYGKNSVKK
jgi:hypothetical protein